MIPPLGGGGHGFDSRLGPSVLSTAPTPGCAFCPWWYVAMDAPSSLCPSFFFTAKGQCEDTYELQTCVLIGLQKLTLTLTAVTHAHTTPSLKLKLGLIQTQFTQKPMLRGKVRARALRACPYVKRDAPCVLALPKRVGGRVL